MIKSLCFDYYYGSEAEQFSFYRIPKTLMTAPHFKKLSSDAKILYGLMLDRMSMSMKNGWLDDKNKVYVFFTGGWDTSICTLCDEVQKDSNGQPITYGWRGALGNNYEL